MSSTVRIDRISVDELAQMINRGEAPVIFDVRGKITRFKDGMLPGAIAADTSKAQAILDLYPRDSEVVVYCSCPNEASAAVAALHLKRADFRKIRPLLGGIEAWVRAGRPVITGA